METLVAVQLEPQQAHFLKLCNDNYATIFFMHTSGVFQLRGSNAILSFDPVGGLKTIKTETFHYSQKQH